MKYGRDTSAEKTDFVRKMEFKKFIRTVKSNKYVAIIQTYTAELTFKQSNIWTWAFANQLLQISHVMF